MRNDSPPATPPLATLKSVLELEARRGYDNRAVVGGLAAFLERCQEQLPFTEVLLAQARSYGTLSTAERRAVIAELCQALEGIQRTQGPPPRGPGGPTTGSPKSLAHPRERSTGHQLTRRSATTAPAPGRLSPSTPLAALPGVGPARAKRLAGLDLHTAGDVRLHLPHRYLAYPPPRPAAELGFQALASFEGAVVQLSETALSAGRRRITAWLRDATGTVGALWIRAGRRPLGIREGMRLAVSGPLIRYGRQLTFENPDYEPADRPPLHTRRMVPVYPLTAGISQLFLRPLIRQVLEWLPPAEEDLPDGLREEEKLLDRQEALTEIHWPTSEERLQEARQRLGFDELLPIQLLVLQRRQEYQSSPGPRIEIPWALLAELRQQLPFALTGGQQRALSAILADLAGERPMTRLLQGDVGSGKTVVAAMVLLTAVARGGQGALIAPTEILAEQHLRTLTELYGRASAPIEAALGHPLRVRLLTGALTQRGRQETLAQIAAGEVDLVIGTHAVIEGDVEFPRLFLAVVDEQHRFGVLQRLALRHKGESPHLLVMTATPIPRTLALTAYGDLDISFIDEMPPGRQAVETILLQPHQRAQAYGRVRSAVASGHQAFVLCPLVEGSATIEARAAVTEYNRLRTGELYGLRLALLHGRMRPAAKDDVMRAFARGEYDVLVSTPVVEVGVDVPNATVMLVEGAERFGLAQLHQFRGRVGRGTAPACCFLVAGGDSPEALARLDAVARSSDGLELAEEDLRIRGPGEFFGLRQSGFPALQVADITDLAFIQRVRDAAERVLAQDPRLEFPENRALRAALNRLQHQVFEAN